MKNIETIILGGGCFWCLEAVYLHVSGIVDVVSGYAGGCAANPTYEEVSSGETGHAEVVKISFDQNKISLEDVLNIFFTVHNPTTMNRQGNDIGTQYRSIILFSDSGQEKIAKNIIDELEKGKIYDGKIVTELKHLEVFYPAENYHQRYFEKNPDAAYCQIVIAPKVAKFREKFKGLYAQ